ncbi:SusC/RagA family TonB-linked outer membrane protein [Muricauda sp. CAU 1633]|uniref:SusC/RagA family TonB-linked outer membrane protein n=1 Tax=Allomuricauda sp. CAU 1633 TaxID=2816036 RepID=UPI001A8E812A|nr:SusC/RagA family TonB-linked outer membrane protein [Muricauda sp. CAU 1633]MBO0321374.1 SusC/RagA family TonB-linked outer membrane protein [Muricauda sp. CAU 1633]
MKITLLRSLLLLGAFLCFSLAKAQTVSGTVSDANGPLPGASVLVRGTTNGTQTDFDGNYTLDGIGDSATLVFSYIGYKSVEVAVNGRSTIDITLEEDAQALDEVVIIGYGQTTVKDATGAVAAVTSEDFNGGVIASPEQLIQGKTAGVQITQSSGEPGAGINIRIRGANSIRSNNNPLFVVDGIPISGESTTPEGGDISNGTNATRNPLNFINPSDIESMSILKDASATAIYGSRGANGVVIITTKTGKAGQGGVWEFNSNLSISSPANKYDLFDADEFLTQTAAIRSQEIADGNDFGYNTDWQDYITRTVASQNQNLSYSNNYGSGNVRATFSYGKQFGVIEKSSQERITGRINANHRFLDDKLKLSLQASASRVNDEAPPISGSAGASGNLIGAAYSANPTWPADPNFFLDGNLINPANYLANWQSETFTDRYLINFSAEYDVTDELTAKVAVGYDDSDAEAISVISPNINNFDRVSGNGQAAYNTLKATSQLLEATLSYQKDFGNSSIDAIVGYTFQDFRRQGFNSQGWGSPTPNLDNMGDLLVGAINGARNAIVGPYQQFGYDSGSTFVNRILPTLDEESTLPSGVRSGYLSLWGDEFDNTDELQSFFGRINYSLNNKYLFTATLRADGSSRFGGNNKYGYFPSGAFAWKLTEEDFIGDAFSTLKLRLSVGVTGNQEGLGYANYLKRTRFAGPVIDNDGSINRPGTETVAVQNPDLKWESTLDYNIGVDFGFNNDRFSGTLDFYRKETSDLLFRQPAAAPAFDPFTFKNLEDGTLINQGVELSLNYDFIQTADVTFSTSFNISYNDNTVEGLNGTTANFGILNGPGLTGAFAQRLGEGRSIFSYYMATYDENGFSADDKDFVDEDAVPDVISGLALNLRVKNWDVSTFFTGQFGFSVYNNTANAFLNRPTFETSRNSTPEGLQLLSQEVSTLYLEKGDFVRWQNASIGYNVPLSGSGALKSLRFSVTGQNLALFTDYSGLDPEVSSSTASFTDARDVTGGIPSQGIDYTSFPRPRTFTLGINAKF